MKTAYGVSLTNSVRKTQDPKDIVNFQIWIASVQYYSKDSDRVNGQFPKTVRLARPMSRECAEKLAAQLKGTAHEIKVVEIVADDDQFLPQTLDELKSAVDEPPGITALKSSVEFCLKSGMDQSEVLKTAKSEVSGAARLRAAVQECLADKRIEDTDILTVVTTAVQG